MLDIGSTLSSRKIAGENGRGDKGRTIFGICSSLLATDAKGQQQIQLDFYINPAEIGFKTVKDRRLCNLDIAIFHADKKGRILNYDWKRLEGLLSEEDYNRITKNGISFSIAVPVKPQTRVLRIVIFDEEGNNIGGKLVNLP